MKVTNALELDWNELMGLQPPRVWPVTVKIALCVATLLGLWVWTLKIADTIGLWTAPRPLPSTTKISPLLKARSGEPSYYFSSRTESFGGHDLSRIRELSVRELESMILMDTPYGLRDKMRPYLPLALKMAEFYQVDPFWVLAVMWTESHFNPKAVSPVRAKGLMQIMPTTGTYLVRRMSPHENLSGLERYRGKTAREIPLFDPILNIEMGTYYLGYLLNQFKGNYRLATVAYNMGPNGVRRRLRQQLPTGVRNQYLNKVRSAYLALTQSYIAFLESTSPPYLQTYVVAPGLRPKKQFVSPLAQFPFETGTERLGNVQWRTLNKNLVSLDG